MRTLNLLVLTLAAIIWLSVMTHAANLTPALTPEMFDVANSAAFFDGKVLNKPTLPMLNAAFGLQDGPLDWGTGEVKGTSRHFIVAFTRALELGTIVTPDYPGTEKIPLKSLSGSYISVLKPDAPFPGDPYNDAQWLLLPPGKVKYLPPGYKARALRFSNVSLQTDWRARDFRFGRVACLKERCYSAQDFGRETLRRPEGDVETLLTAWNIPQPISGIVIFSDRKTTPTVSQLHSTVTRTPELAEKADWMPARPAPAGVISFMNFPEPLETRAFQITGPPVSRTSALATACPLVLLGDQLVSPAILPAAPLRIQYPMPMDGFIAIDVHEKKSGKLVRRIISETARDNGPGWEPWDLRDEAGNLVPPGDYVWKGIARPPFKLTYEMTAYNAGIPAWWAPEPGKGGGGWMADHAPSSSVATFDDRMWISSPCAESGHSLIATDLDGIKQWGVGIYHFGFDGPLAVTADARFGYALTSPGIFRVDTKNAFALRKIFNAPDPAPDGFPWSPSVGRITTGHNGLATRDNRLYVAVDGPSPSWLRSTFSSAQMDPALSQPFVFLKKGKGSRTSRFNPYYDWNEYDELMLFYATFLTDKMPAVTPSLANEAIPHAEQVFYGDAPAAGKLAGSLIMALKEEVTVGTIIIPDGGIKVFALKPGKKMSELFNGLGPKDIDLGGPFGLDLDDDEALEDAWIPLTVIGKAGAPALVVAPEGGLRTSALRYQVKRLKYSLVTARRFDDVAGQAERVGSAGAATAQGGWQVRRKSPIFASAPVSMALVWPQAHALRGLILTNPTEGSQTAPARIAFDAWQGPDNANPRDALQNNQFWKQVTITQNEHEECFRVDFGQVVETRAIRVRFLSSYGVGNDFVAGFTSVMALRYLGGDPPGLSQEMPQRVVELQLPDPDDDKAMATIARNIPLPHPVGLAFAPEGTLYAISDGQVVTVPLAEGAPSRVVIPRTALEDPVGITCDASGMLYLTDNGPKVIKVFDAQRGTLLRTIGTPGGTKAGKWDPARLVNPAGLAVDKLGKTWIADYTYTPKRIQRFTADGQPDKAFLGPTAYGGGGRMDANDRRYLYYQGMKFILDWDKRTWELDSLLGQSVDRTIYYQGQRYLVNGNQITQERNRIAVPMAYFGVLSAWSEYADNTAILQMFSDVDPNARLVLWCDRNSDGQAQPEEVQWKVIPAYPAPACYVGEDLTFYTVNQRVKAEKILPGGVPVYNLDTMESFTNFARPGYNTNLWGDEKGRIFMIGTRLIAADGKTMDWEYYNQYAHHDGFYRAGFGYNRPPGVLNQEHFVVGHITVGKEEFYITNSDPSDFYCYTADGMLVGCLFGGPAGYGLNNWTIPEWEPGKVNLDDLRPGQEHYAGSVVRTDDGNVYAIVGHNHMSVVRIDGLESLQRLGGELTITEAELEKTREWKLQCDMREQARKEAKVTVMPRIETPLTISGNLAEWPQELFVEINRQVVTGLHSLREYVTAEGALAYDEDNLYIAIRSQDTGLPANAAEDLAMIFKGGDAAEITLGMDTSADRERKAPVAGDLRILLTFVKGEPVAVLYKPVDPTAPLELHKKFSSPVSRFTMDRVEILRGVHGMQLGARLTEEKKKDTEMVTMWAIEAAIPWKALGVKAPEEGTILRGDFGVLQSDAQGMRTTNRQYWSGKAQKVVADVPSEARLSPALWGEILCVRETKNLRFNTEDPVEVDILP